MKLIILILGCKLRNWRTVQHPLWLRRLAMAGWRTDSKPGANSIQRSFWGQGNCRDSKNIVNLCCSPVFPNQGAVRRYQGCRQVLKLLSYYKCFTDKGASDSYFWPVWVQPTFLVLNGALCLKRLKTTAVVNYWINQLPSISSMFYARLFSPKFWLQNITKLKCK